MLTQEERYKLEMLRINIEAILDEKIPISLKVDYPYTERTRKKYGNYFAIIGGFVLKELKDFDNERPTSNQ